MGHVADAHERDDLAEAQLLDHRLEALADRVGDADTAMPLSMISS
jgi:hypothetical protein